MDTLALWLKKIVLLVLLATVLDLLLPNTELQRYVKLVMGLIILLVILNPILTLVSPHITDEWITLQAAGTGPVMESVDTIAEKGRALRQDLDRRALEEARTRVEELVRRQVETAFGYTVDEVVVEWSREKDGVALAALTVSVRERRDAAEAPRGGRRTAAEASIPSVRWTCAWNAKPNGKFLLRVLRAGSACPRWKPT